MNKRNFDVGRLGSLKSVRKHLYLEDDLIMLRKKFVIPKSLRKRVLQCSHDHSMAGHFASERTYKRFRNTFYWPKAYDDVVKYTHQCQKCNEFNVPLPGYVKVPLQPIETQRRFELVCYDLAGPFLPITVRGNRYALIIVDHY